MIPTITLDLRRLTHGSAHEPSGTDERPMGETHTFSAARLGATADEHEMPVDDLLAWHTAGGLQPGRPASPVLVLYGRTTEFVQLTVCGPWVGATLTRIPGRLESGRGRALPNARPLLYWDGRRLRRVYEMIQGPAASGPLVADLNAPGGARVIPGDPKAARLREAGAWADPWHSPVPDAAEREITLDGEGRRVGYAWWRDVRR